jgi:methionyl-tRNA formyltransferase
VRIGLIISDDSIKNYEIIELKNLLNKYKISVIFNEIINQDSSNKFLKIFKSIVLNKFYYLIFVERKIANIITKKNCYDEKIKKLNKKINIIKKFKSLNKVKKINFKCSKTENKYTFDTQTKNMIKKNCDLLIMLGFNKILHQNSLGIVKYGILSFHTADTNKYRGRPSGFYEFINNEDYGGLTLQLLNKELDFGKIVEQRNTYIKNCKSYDETIYKMMKLKKDMISNGVRKIVNKEKFFYPKKTSKLAFIKQSRNFLNVFKCLKKTIYKRYL